MKHSTFWSIINTARETSTGISERVEIIRMTLKALPLEEITAFQNILYDYLHMANRWELWGAAYVVGRGCSDDAFESVRLWLILNGEECLYQAIKYPDAYLENGIDYAESLLIVAPEVYEEQTGKWMPNLCTRSAEPVGSKWAEDELPKLFPRLWAKFRQRQKKG